MPQRERGRSPAQGRDRHDGRQRANPHPRPRGDARALTDVLPRFGGAVLYAGDGDLPLVAEDGQAWDAVLCVRYPSRRAFSEMVADPDYQQVTHLRTDALEEAVLQPTSPWT